MVVGPWRDLVPGPFLPVLFVSWLPHCEKVHITTIFSLSQAPSSTANQPEKEPPESPNQPQKGPSESTS